MIRACTLFSFLILLSFLILTGTSTAQELPPLKIEKYELSNGLDVIFHEDHTIPTVTVNVWYHVGSKNEKAGKTGYAHLFEHMMFEGSEHYPEDFSEPYDRIGGDNNASTNEDRTNYYETVPSNYLEMALWLESDRMAHLLLTDEKLAVQRDVVKNERRQRLDNQPYAKMYELSLETLYPEGHPYRWSVIGYMEDIAAASLADVQDFYEMYYAPNNASLTIAGDFDPAEVKQLVERYFASIPPGPPVDRLQQWVPTLDGVKRVVAQDVVSLPRYHCIWHTPPLFAPGDAEADLLATILASGKTSRLHKTLVYDKQIAQDVSAYQSSGELGSTFNIEVTAREGHTCEEMEKAVDEILRDVLDKGIRADELKRAQTGYEAGFVRSLQTVSGRANSLNSYNVWLGTPDRFQWDLERYTKATVEDVNRFARKWLDLNRRAILYTVPQGDPTASGEPPVKTTLPEGGADPEFHPPVIQRATLSNGVPLLLVEKHTLPLVQINLAMKVGMAADPVERPGLASLAADLLREGTKTRTALQISDEARALGANLGTGASFDATTVSLNVLRKNLDPALDLMADIVLNPTFPDEELDRLRKNYLGRIQQENRRPFTSALKAYYRLLFGEGHPYSQPYTGTGTEKSVNAVTRDEIVNFYKTSYSPTIAGFVVVGDITLTEAKEKLDRAFRSWKAIAVTLPEIPDPQPFAATKILIVDKPRAPQSAIVLGNAGISRTDPEYVSCEVMNHILGGLFTSRINTNLREEKGYTYGARSVFVTRRGRGPFLAYAEVQTEVTDESIAEFLKELRDVGGPRPLTPDELKKSKDDLTKSYPQDFETFTEIAGSLNQLFVYDLPADEWTTYLDKVRAVDGAAATQVASRHIHPDQMLIVIVGDREVIEPELRKLNIGDIEVVSLKDL
ncbi:insulinase family protein [bacterium]|nr:insulinase family protein [bacterium]MBU1984522.1 insulinase family protein [bacterium]